MKNRVPIPIFLLIVLLSLSAGRLNMHYWKLTVNNSKIIDGHSPALDFPVLIDTAQLLGKDTVKFYYHFDSWGSGHCTTRLFLESADGTRQTTSEVFTSDDELYGYFTIDEIKQLCIDHKSDTIMLLYSYNRTYKDQSRKEEPFSEPRGMVKIVFHK